MGASSQPGVSMRRTILMFALLAFGCTPPEGQEPGECTDRLDNDADGLYDCEDPDCAGSPDCAEGDADTDVDADGDTDTDTDHEETGWPPCGVTIDEVVPRDGSTDAYYRGDIEFWLDDPDTTNPYIVVTGPSGDVGGVSFVSDDRELVWLELHTPLEPLTAYEATLHYCNGTATSEFTTSELGQPVTADLEGRTYAVNMASGRYIDPPGVGELLGEFAEGQVLLGVERLSGTFLTVIAGMSEEGDYETQDLCFQTTEDSCDYSAPPFFSFGPKDLSYSYGGQTFTVSDVELSGAFTADGSGFGGGDLSLVLDAREVVVVIDEVDTHQDLCNLTASFGAPCEACPSDGVEACLSLRVDQLEAEQVAGLVLETVPPEGHEDCEGTPGCGGCASGGRTLGFGGVGILLGAVLLAARRRREDA